jgi:hypothetical protein
VCPFDISVFRLSCRISLVFLRILAEGDCVLGSCDPYIAVTNAIPDTRTYSSVIVFEFCHLTSDKAAVREVRNKVLTHPEPTAVSV